MNAKNNKIEDVCVHCYQQVTMNQEAQCKLIVLLKEVFEMEVTFQDFHYGYEVELAVNSTKVLLQLRERTLPGTDIRVQFMIVSGKETETIIKLISNVVLTTFGYEKVLSDVKYHHKQQMYYRTSNQKRLEDEWGWNTPPYKRKKIQKAMYKVHSNYKKYKYYLKKLDEFQKEQTLASKQAKEQDECYKWESEYEYSRHFPDEDEFWEAWRYRKYISICKRMRVKL